MAETNDEFPTIIGSDAKFKGELTFEKGVRIEGSFEGQITSKGTLHIAEGSHITANVQAANVKVEGECKGNIHVTEKLHLLATAKMEGDLRTNRLEIADGAIFCGNVVVGQAAAEAARRPAMPADSAGHAPHRHPDNEQARTAPSQTPGSPRPRPQEIRIGANPS